MRRRRSPALAVVRPAPCPSSDRNPSRSGPQPMARSPVWSLWNDFAADILSPIVRVGIFRAPFLRGLAAEQVGKNDPRLGSPDDNVAVVRFDLHPFAVAQPGGLDDLARQADRQVIAPFANRYLHHYPPGMNIPSIFMEPLGGRTTGPRLPSPSRDRRAPAPGGCDAKCRRHHWTVRRSHSADAILACCHVSRLAFNRSPTPAASRIISASSVCLPSRAKLNLSFRVAVRTLDSQDQPPETSNA